VPKAEKYVPKFETDGAELYIDGQKVLRAWDSILYVGVRWYGVKKKELREISPEDGKRHVKDVIWYCLIKGRNDYYDWDNYSQRELYSKWYAYPILKRNLLKSAPISTEWL
jgi:predicted PolB exonuclease-like 3'-5' exonuclease